MNIFLQIGIGLIPAFLFVILLSIKRRVFSLKILLSILVVGAIIFTSIYLSDKNFDLINNISNTLNNHISDFKPQNSNEVNNSNMPSKNQILSLANYLIVSEDYEDVKNVINDYAEIYGYDDECRLINARVGALNYDYSAACALYDNLKNNTKLIKKDEEKIHINLSNSNKPNVEEIKPIINKIISSDYSDMNEAVTDKIDALVRISNNNQKYDMLADDIETLKNIDDKNTNILNIDSVDKLLVKGQLLNADYEGLISDLNDDSSYHRLITVAELIINDLVDKNIENIFDNQIDNTKIEDIKTTLNNILKNNANILSNQEKEIVIDRVLSLNNQLDDEILYNIKNKLMDLVNLGKDESKVDFALSKIYNYFGDDLNATDYFNKALDTAYKSDDYPYKESMDNVYILMNNSIDNFNTSVVNNYLNTANINSLTVDNDVAMPVNIQTKEKKGFVKNLVDYTIKSSNYISIVDIDKTKFKNISADVIITNEQSKTIKELEDSIEIRDCNEVVKARFDKYNYDSINILLACDLSGSMSNNVTSLKSAIYSFINNRNENENLSIVTFNANINGERTFGSSDDSLNSFVDKFVADGNTNIYNTVLQCLGKFPKSNNNKNILIVMTDGQDGNRHNIDDINRYIGNAAEKSSASIFTMGLGNDVDASYLRNIANAGKGSYLPVQDGDSLLTFYNMLHLQANNLYKITYEAKNETTKKNRTLEVLMPNTLYKDKKLYSLVSDNNNNISTNSNVYNINLNAKGKIIKDIQPKLLYKQSNDSSITLLGENFEKNDDVIVKLIGAVEYNLDIKYKDSEKYELIIPSNISIGNYDVVVSINNDETLMQSALKVSEVGERHNFKFGEYIFTYDGDSDVSENGGYISGNVQMNEWLSFKGMLSFKGNYKTDYYLSFSDISGSYIEFDKTDSTGTAKTYADNNIVVDIPALNNFKLYNDDINRFDLDNYQVDNIKIPQLELKNWVSFDNPKINLYPDKLNFSVNDNIGLLAFDKTFRKLTKGVYPFGGGINMEKATISKKSIDAKFKVDFGLDKAINDFVNIPFLNGFISISPNLKAEFDTIKDEMEVEFSFSPPIFNMDSINEKGRSTTLMCMIGIKKCRWEKWKTGADVPIIIASDPPIEISNFTGEISNISDATSDGFIDGFINKGDWKKLKFTASLDISSLKASGYFELLKSVPVVNDLALLSMPETTVSIVLSPFAVEGEAKLQFLGLADIESFEFKVGNYNWTSSLLNVNDEEFVGFMGQRKRGIVLDGIAGYFSDRLYIEMSGKISAIYNNRFIGFTNLGTNKVKISLWLIDKDFSSYSDMAIGFYKTHKGKQQLIFARKAQNSGGKNKSEFYYLDDNWKIGYKSGQLT